jgi:hypothetical protein
MFSQMSCAGRLAVVGLLTAGACAHRPAATVDAAAPATARSAPLFDFHADFWVNLHQRLYPESSPRGVSAPLQAGSPSEQQAWAAAVDGYRRHWPTRSLMTLLGDQDLARVQQALTSLPPDGSVGELPLPADVRAALAAAAPIYRECRWPEDERLAKAFIARMTPLVERHGPALAAALSRAYQRAWPAQPIRVEVAAYAGPVGAYTLLEPTHTTIASADPRHEGDAGLEILFHEASHALVAPVEEAIARAAAARGRPVPPGLWHAVLFWVTGELVRRELGPSYVPYATHNGLWTRGPGWAAYEPALAQHWPAYLDGKETLDAAVGQLVAALP